MRSFTVIYTLCGHKLRFMKRLCVSSLDVLLSQNTRCSGVTSALFLNQNVQLVDTSAFPNTQFMTSRGIADRGLSGNIDVW